MIEDFKWQQSLEKQSLDRDFSWQLVHCFTHVIKEHLIVLTVKAVLQEFRGIEKLASVRMVDREMESQIPSGPVIYQNSTYLKSINLNASLREEPCASFWPCDPQSEAVSRV
jgi:hypothetical protein